MKHLVILLGHLLTTIAKPLGPSGLRAVVADSLLMKQQRLTVNRFPWEFIAVVSSGCLQPPEV